mgnify:CR=1 FL=1
MASVSTSSSADAAAPSEETPSLPLCGNCNTPLQGDYCHACGQRHLPRVTLHHLFHRLQELLLDVENGLLHTTWHVLRHPGNVARRYVSGERKPFVGPVAFFFLTTTALFLIYTLFEDEYVRLQTTQIRTALEAVGMQGIRPENPFASLIGGTSPEDLARWTFQVQKTLQTYLSLVVCLIGAGLLSVLFPARSFIESVVFELYTVSQSLLLIAVATLLLFFVDPGTLLLVAPLISLGAHAWAAPAFFTTSSTTTARTMVPLMYAAGGLIFMVLVMLAGLLVGVGHAVLSL